MLEPQLQFRSEASVEEKEDEMETRRSVVVKEAHEEDEKEKNYKEK